MKRLIFISEMHQIPSLIAYGGDIIIALKREIADVLQSKNIRFKCLDDYPAPSEEAALKWMKDWPRKKVGGKSFIERFSYDGLSVWWLMENWLYYSSVYFDSLRNVMSGLETIETILKQERPDEIVFVDDGKINSEILKLFTEYKQNILPTKLFKNVYSIKRNIKVSLISIFIDFGFGIRKFLWSIIKPFRKRAIGKVLLISTYEWGLAKKKSGGYASYDPFIDPIISALDRSVETVNIPVGRLLGLRQMIRNSKAKVIESYYNRVVRKKCSVALKSILDGWNSLKPNKKFVNSFQYRNKNIWPLLEKQFSAYFSCRLKGHIRDAEIVKTMIETDRPKIIVYPAETSEFGRTLFHFCNIYRIPSIGIQHGVFNNYLACIHKKGESQVGVAALTNCPIPTKTFVYGPLYKRMLIKGHYAPDSVIVTGSQRFDRIIKEKNKFDKYAFCRAVGLDNSKKIVAFVTSPVPLGDTEVMTSAVVEAVEKAGAQLVIKLHPSEDFSVYKGVAAELRSNPVIVRDIDLYELLDACDVMITHLSTAAVEAMIFDKPVILLNLTGKPDRVDYAKKGAAFGVYKKDWLFSTLEKLLSDKHFYNKRRKHTRSFVHDAAYLSDGKAAQRMAQDIEKLIE